MKYKINLDRPVFDLVPESESKDCKKDTPQKLGQALGLMLKSATDGDALKYLCWAIELFGKGQIEVDESDYQHLIEFVKNNKQTWALVKGQLLLAFAEAKQEKKA